jgi:hypothetical protein
MRESRNMVASFFTKEAIKETPSIYSETVDSLLDAMIKKGCEKPVDLIEEFALPDPSYAGTPSFVEQNLLEPSRLRGNLQQADWVRLLGNGL